MARARELPSSPSLPRAWPRRAPSPRLACPFPPWRFSSLGSRASPRRPFGRQPPPPPSPPPPSGPPPPPASWTCRRAPSGAPRRAGPAGAAPPPLPPAARASRCSSPAALRSAGLAGVVGSPTACPARLALVLPGGISVGSSQKACAQCEVREGQMLRAKPYVQNPK
eukprot:23896-Prorocentrum_minimum.AAC.3